MSGRCKSCNDILTEDEMRSKYPGTSEYIDMCYSCQDKTSENVWEDDDWEQLELVEFDDEQLV